MLVPLIWQKDYIKIDKDLKRVTDRLSETGSHVEEVTIHTSDLEGIVVGHVLEQKDHPDADRLRVLTIDIGRDEPITIITNAKNTKKGDFLPVITSGTKMDNGILIEDHDFFGIVSQGMLTAYSELGYDDSVIPKELREGVIVLAGEFKPGTPACEALFSNTPVIEYEITPNRSDCLSIIGMARETAASFGEKIAYPSLEYSTNGEDIKDYANGVEVKSDSCLRFTARVVKDVKIEKSPQWLQNYLMLAGVRPINNIVDITNFVMLETGQPLHAYDLDRLAGKKIIVRDAKEGEVIKTLDGEERKLDPSMLVIADDKEAIGLAGVMGGFDSEITNDTKNILLEAASFDADNIRDTSKKLNLRSEASSRFEKGVAVETPEIASKRVMKLIEELGIGTIIGGSFDEGKKENDDKEVKLRITRLNSLTGVDFTKEEAIKNLELLEFEVKDIDEDTITAKAPYFRNDISIEADLIEEVVRLYGMGKIESKPLVSSLKKGERSPLRLLRDDLKYKLVGQKFSELATYSFISPREYDRLGIAKDSKLRDYISLINPLGEDFSVMRTTQIANMLDVIAKNIKYGQKDMRFFELDRTFEKTNDQLPKENLTLTMGLYGDYSFYDMKDFFTEAMRNIGFTGFSYKTNENLYAFHAGRCADIYFAGQKIGVIGEISYEVREEYNINKGAIILEINLSQIAQSRITDKKYKQIPKFPAIERDYSFVADRDVESELIENIMKEKAGDLLYKIELFDIYTGKGIADNQKSISYRVWYRKADRTLKEEDIKGVEESILEELKAKNIVLRG
ncbi:phenylalanine--tRNA ligase subunit beta [Anaerococcus degeneri]|uniref:Phenylalanine--tRNA ligase beta subunit n=1 Tax=Anaerococcus degeneri TaxID=361500 RepID=A0ABS7YXV1_9FIRM|nr:phenylalanine--tRNA ligase subunit beta [Anaerococcus degeneri]MBP2015429.1 phenylalanyl-tRNA synthetase beta chain [Anaerococcus degeneri]MCA2095788.1 phenylalanine--tRNA ligase subunit beta [Anaerococcus degeneri]